MTLEARCRALVKLGEYLLDGVSEPILEDLYGKAEKANGWFTIKNCKASFNQFAKNFLDKKNIEEWISKYPEFSETKVQNIGIIAAGNIPAVGFHDILCSFISGNNSLIKYSEKDNVLIPFLLGKLTEFYPESASSFVSIDRLQEADKIIATGSDNSSRYFEYYFSKYKHIIRSNRNSVAVLDGSETEEDILQLGNDVFNYFGLGCRSVSKIYMPEGYGIEFLMRLLDTFSEELLSNSKYKNNFDYNRSIYLLNGEKHWCNDSVILLENKSMQSRIATLHVEFYNDINRVEEDISLNSDKIQCVVSGKSIKGVETVVFGKSQYPRLEDYADNVDTMQFLLN